MKYLVGFSGGTDSVFVSWYLKQKGYEVLPVNLKNTKERNKCCSLPTELMDIVAFLDLPLKIVDATKDFKKLVIEDFVENYLNGKTPNPCINCNENVRFKILEQIRKELNYDYVSTGHYVKKIEIKLNNGDVFYTFAIPEDKKKDQTYMLYRLVKHQDIVKHLDFPIHNFKKEQIKQIISENKIPINVNQESQNICFIPDDDYPRFIKQSKTINIPTGKIIDTKGNYLGEHKGLIYYTIGQRKGLNLKTNEKKYVIDLDWKNNILIVGDDKELYKTSINVENMVGPVFDFDLEKLKQIFGIENVYGKIRYKGDLVKVEKIGKTEVVFQTPVRAVTKGQHLVLYGEKDNEFFVIGGGVIG